MGPTPKEKKKKKMQKQNDGNQNGSERERGCRVIFFNFFFLLLGFSQIQGKSSVRIRRDKHGKCSTRRGLRVSTRNTRFHREFR